MIDSPSIQQSEVPTTVSVPTLTFGASWVGIPLTPPELLPEPPPLLPLLPPLLPPLPPPELPPLEPPLLLPPELLPPELLPPELLPPELLPPSGGPPEPPPELLLHAGVTAAATAEKPANVQDRTLD